MWSQQSQILSHGLGAQAPESLYLWQEHIEQARPNLTNLNSDINTLDDNHSFSDEQYYPHEPKIIRNTNIYPLKLFFQCSSNSPWDFAVCKNCA